MSPLVSVVLLNWNGTHLLPTCLDSLRAQTFRDFEIIMPHNGSTDGSLELVAARYPEVQVLKFTHNRGLCLSMNDGHRAARGDFIAALNNDTEMDPRYLEDLVGAMQADPQVGVRGPKMVYYDAPELINSAGHACGPDGVVVELGRLEPDCDWFDQPREVLGARRVISQLWRQRFAVVLFAHERDQYLQPAFWKAMPLPSGARRKAACPDGELGAEGGSLRLLAGGKWGALTRVAAECYVAMVGLTLLLVLLGIVVTDAVDAAIGGRRASGAGQS